MGLSSILESVANSISALGFHWNLCRVYKDSLKILDETEKNSTEIYNKVKAIQPSLDKLLENSGLPVFQRKKFHFVLELKTVISEYVIAYNELCKILTAESFPLDSIDKVINNDSGVSAWVGACKRKGVDPADLKKIAYKIVDLCPREIAKAR